MKKLFTACLVALLLAACAGGKSKNEGLVAPVHHFAFSDQTAVDEGTGLVWSRNANLPGKALYWKADDNVYTFIRQLNRENYAGYGDWRLPIREELEGLLKYAKSQGYDAGRLETWPYRQLRRLGFQDVRDYAYWSSTRNSKDTREFWVADLLTGRMATGSENSPYCVWPVRGGR